jgi:hypothetical protein
MGMSKDMSIDHEDAVLKHPDNRPSRLLALKIVTLRSDSDLVSKIEKPQKGERLRMLDYDRGKTQKALRRIGIEDGNIDPRVANTYSKALEVFWKSIKEEGEQPNPDLDLLKRQLDKVCQEIQWNRYPNLEPFMLANSVKFFRTVFREGGNKGPGPQGAWRMLPLYLMTGIDPSKRQKHNDKLYFAEEMRDELAPFMQTSLEIGDDYGFSTCDFRLDKVPGNDPDEVWRGNIVAHKFSLSPQDFKVFHGGDFLFAGQLGFKKIRLTMGTNQDSEKPNKGKRRETKEEIRYAAPVPLSVSFFPIPHMDVPQMAAHGQELITDSDHPGGHARGAWELNALKVVEYKDASGLTVKGLSPSGEPERIHFCDNNPSNPTVWGAVVVKRSDSGAPKDVSSASEEAMIQSLKAKVVITASLQDMKVDVSPNNDEDRVVPKDQSERVRALVREKFILHDIAKELGIEGQDVVQLDSKTLIEELPLKGNKTSPTEGS